MIDLLIVTLLRALFWLLIIFGSAVTLRWLIVSTIDALGKDDTKNDEEE